jgi:hypothetical protein
METGAVMGSVASPSADRMTRPLAVSLARGVDDVTGTRADLLAQLPLRERVWLPRGEAARYDPGTQLSRSLLDVVPWASHFRFRPLYSVREAQATNLGDWQIDLRPTHVRDKSSHDFTHAMPSAATCSRTFTEHGQEPSASRPRWSIERVKR